MVKNIKFRLIIIKVFNALKKNCDRVKIPGLKGLSLYDLLNLYIIGIIKGSLTTRAGGISFSFFMAVFPFFLFILTLIPYIPIENFSDGLFSFIEKVLPPHTFQAVRLVLEDILNNQYGGLLSFSFLMSIFLMTNGVNAIFGGFEHSYHVTEFRSFFKTYFISLCVSLLISLFLIITISLIALYQIALVKIDEISWFNTDNLDLLNLGKNTLFLLMVFIVVSLLLKYGTTQGKKIRFFSIGSLLTTIISFFSFFLFKIYVLKFSQYNQLYGSIGTLLILMLFVWLNSIILLLGFELNASIYKLKQKNLIKQ